MLKDNHISFAGSITNAVKKVRDNISHAHKIEVECDTKEQVLEALENNVDIIMLDNMTLEQIKRGMFFGAILILVMLLFYSRKKIKT